VDGSQALDEIAQHGRMTAAPAEGQAVSSTAAPA
jgi:hypothetical protein